MNKIRLYLILAMILSFPMLVTSLVTSFIGFEYWVIGPSESMKFFMGKMNNPWIVIMSLINILSVSVILTVLMFLSRYTSKIDRLEEARETYNKATMDMIKLRDAYTKQLQNISK